MGFRKTLSKFISYFGLAVITFSYSGCFNSQISSLQAYNGYLEKPTNKCQVIRTSLATTFVDAIKENKDAVLGDSQIETYGSYENAEAAFDCMAIGAKSVLILNKGIMSTSTSTFYVQTGYVYTPISETRQIAGYQIVFFNKELPMGSVSITEKNYSEWAKNSNIGSCLGCKTFNRKKQ